MGKREPEELEKKKSKVNKKKNFWSDFLAQFFSILLAGIILAYISSILLEPILKPYPDFEIECYDKDVINPYVIIRNKGDLAGENVGLYILADQKCSFITSELSALLFDDINVSWYQAPTNVPYLPSPGYFDTYIHQENWPTNLELNMKCDKYPVIVEISIGGDNFESIKKGCKLKESKIWREVWEKIKI